MEVVVEWGGGRPEEGGHGRLDKGRIIQHRNGHGEQSGNIMFKL